MARTDAVLDALALVEATMRGDGEARAVLLDHADLLAVCTVLADILAGYLNDGDPASMREVLAELARLRPALAAAGNGPAAGG